MSRRIENSPPNRLRLPQAHLTFGWMDVAIDEVQVHLDMKHTNGMLAALKRARIGLAKRLLDRRAMDGTPVKDHKLLKAVAPSLPGTR